MSENFTNTEKLIQYMEGELHGDARTAVEQMLAGDAKLSAELENLRATKSAVSTYGLKQRIGAIHTDMMEELSAPQVAKVVGMKKILSYSWRVAAVLVLLLGVSLLYQYYNATPDQLYKSNFASYQLRETRGASNNSSLEAPYSKGDYAATMIAFKQIAQPSAEDYFLYANAALALNKPSEAIQSFTMLQQSNQQNKTHLFEEDTEYYLAMAYLHNNEPVKALPLFEKIHHDEGHPYNKKVGTWFLRKIKRLAQ